MKSQLFIPDKIKVGYQHREDTYTKKLAYIIYYDKKGVLRKETSWNGWRTKNLGSDEFENKPHSGFILNKDVQRSSDWFGSGRNMIRIYDDRGIEFEITCANLMFILMTTNCHKRGLEGEFVYAWYGKDLVLLPVGCEEYQKSVGFTELQGKSIAPKSLIPGATYEHKSKGKFIYLGKFDFYEFAHITKDIQYLDHPIFRERRSKKKFVFHRVNPEKYENKLCVVSTIDALARCVDETPVEDFAQRLETLKKDARFSKIIGVTTTELPKLKFSDVVEKPTADSHRVLILNPSGIVVDATIYEELNNSYYPRTVSRRTGFVIKTNEAFAFYEGKLMFVCPTKVKPRYYDSNKSNITQSMAENYTIVKAAFKLESGKVINFQELEKLNTWHSLSF